VITSTPWTTSTTLALPLKCSDTVGLFQPMSTVRRGDIVRAMVVEASERVVDALGGRGDGAATEESASRLRRDLQAEGVVISEMGKASSGRHTVVTLRLPSGAKSALEQLVRGCRCRFHLSSRGRLR
jgi:hypothetical protein